MSRFFTEMIASSATKIIPRKLLECWSSGELENWSVGVLEYWSTGVFVFSRELQTHFPLFHHSIIPILQFLLPVLHFLYSQHLANERNHGRGHNDADNTGYNRRGRRISHGRSTSLTLHSPETS